MKIFACLSLAKIKNAEPPSIDRALKSSPNLVKLAKSAEFLRTTLSKKSLYQGYGFFEANLEIV